MPHHCRQQLSEEELERLEEACDMALELNASKHRIYEYVESRMSFIAPNLSIIIGASTAAKIMGETLGQSGVRGLSLDSATSGTLRPSVRWDTGPRAPAPRPPCPRRVSPARDHRGQPPCFSCRHGERMATLSWAGRDRPEQKVVWPLERLALLGQHVPAAPGSVRTPGLPGSSSVSPRDLRLTHEMGAAVLTMC